MTSLVCVLATFARPVSHACVQTDASINAGSSGGALLDSSGRLVGISTATFSRKGTVRAHTLHASPPSSIPVF